MRHSPISSFPARLHWGCSTREGQVAFRLSESPLTRRIEIVLYQVKVTEWSVLALPAITILITAVVAATASGHSRHSH